MKYKHNILIADNESIVTSDLKDNLKQWGYNVFTSDKNYSVTKEWIQRNNPDAVIIDDDYPIMEQGINTAVEISKQNQVGVILLCAWMNEEIRKISAEIDFIQCLSKPFSHEALQKSLQRILAKRNN